MASGTAKTARVRGDHVVAGLRERRYDLAPGVGELGEAVEKDDKGSISGGGVVGFEDMHGKGIVGGGKGNGSRSYDGVHGVCVCI